ncbi:hypothetical protein CBS14141_004324 [Malassezia furfur]|nr:hypothetical protein CBS14141_004324 [Malassezia furfur]
MSASGADDGADASADAGAGAVLDFSALNTSIEQFARRFERYVHDTVAASDAERLAADTHRVEAHEQRKALEREREATKHAQKRLWETVAAERDADAALRARVQNLHAQRTSLVQRAASLTTEVAEIRAQIEARRAQKQDKMRRLRAQVARNAPELVVLQQCTGLAIEATERPSTLRLVFDQLAPHAAPCTLDLDVGGGKFAVPHHDRRLSEPTVRALVRTLNASGDVYAFLKALRRAMQDAVRT